MLPIRDDNPTHRTAVVTIVLVLASVGVFFFVQPLGEPEAREFMYERAAVSCEVLQWEPLSTSEIETGSCGASGPGPFPDKSVAASIISSMFLHGGLLHLFSNVWVLWIFGDNVEDRMGRRRFLLFYLAAGVVATLVFVFMNPGSTVPLIGASGAISAVMGAYLVLFPTARVVSIIPPLFFLPFRVPALLFLLFWLFAQFQVASQDPLIAWQAHVGGFVAGVVWGVVERSRGDQRRRVRRIQSGT